MAAGQVLVDLGGLKDIMTRILGIDVGDKTLGLALSDDLGLTAQGLETLARRGPRADITKLRALTEEFSVKEIVVGLPKMLNGSLGVQAQKVLVFVELLSQSLGLPVATWDERLTTVAAHRVLREMNVKSHSKRRRAVDSLAAQFILQGYLDHKNASSPRP